MVFPLRLIAGLGLGLLGCGCVTSSDAVTEQPSESETSPASELVRVEIEGDNPELESDPTSTDAVELELDGVQFELDAATCTLTADHAGQRVVHEFAFPAACAFVTDSSGAIRVVETDAGKAVMVESSKPLDVDCDTALRVVVVSKRGPRISQAVQRVAMCAPFDWDEMMFHVLASEPVTFGTAGADP